MQKTIISALIALFIFMGFIVHQINKKALLSGVDNVTVTASSTAFTLSSTSLRLVATSTKRTAFAVQNTNCTSGGVLYLNLGGLDNVATAGNGFAVYASTSQEFSDNNLVPVQTAVQGVVVGGTCTVLVTEFKSNF